MFCDTDSMAIVALLNPTDRDSDDRDWIRQAWEWLIRTHLGLPAAKPSWLGEPATARHAISSPQLHRLLQPLNADLPYTDQTKPMNFLSIAFVAPLERPPDDPDIVLIAPSRDTTTDRLAQTWVNRTSGKTYKITTLPSDARHRPGVVTVKTYRDILAEYSAHPEPKANGTDGPCRRHTQGHVTRRPVRARTIVHIGKEANRLEEARAGLIRDPSQVLSSYDDANALALQRAIPILRKLGVREVARRTGHSLGAVHDALQGASAPRRDSLRRYLEVAREQTAGGSRSSSASHGPLGYDPPRERRRQ